MKFLDFFSGIGGFRLGMEMAGHQCLGHCEIDKYANKSYIAMHKPKEDEWYATDIRTVEPSNLPEADCYWGGFPCQAFSVAGKRRGFEDMRGTLVFEVFRLAYIKRPKILFLENVAGLLNHDGGRTFATILSAMDELGYNAEWQLLNSKNFGVPQNRERVLIVGHLRGLPWGQVFPITGGNTKALKQIIGGAQGERVYDPSKVSCTLSSQGGGQGAKTGLYLINKNKDEIKFKDEINCLDANYYKGLDCHQQRTAVLEVRPIITPDRANKNQNGRLIKESGEPMFTLTAQDRHGVVIREATQKGYNVAYEGDSINLTALGSKTRRGRAGKGIANTLDTSCSQAVLSKTVRSGGRKSPYGTKQNWDSYEVEGRIRRLTPRECFRLQGFHDTYFDRAKAVNSDTQLYKQAGNSVTVNVIYAIAKRLK